MHAVPSIAPSPRMYHSQSGRPLDAAGPRWGYWQERRAPGWARGCRARDGNGRDAGLHPRHQWLVLAAFWREKAGGTRMSSVMWRRAAAKCSNGGLRAPSRRREARSELAQLPRRASPPVLSLCLQPEGGMGGTGVAAPLDEFSDGVAANPAAGDALDREGRNEEVRQGVSVLSHRR